MNKFIKGTKIDGLRLSATSISRLKFKLLTDTAIAPKKAHATDSGFDLYTDETVTIPAGESVKISTGVAFEFPDNWGGVVRPRSGVTAYTKLRVNVGTLDNDYTGDVNLNVDNIGHENIIVRKGTKLAQMVLEYIPYFPLVEVTELKDTERGDKGFGSTGY